METKFSFLPASYVAAVPASPSRSKVLPHHSVNPTPADGAVRTNLPLCHCVKDRGMGYSYIGVDVPSGRMEN